MKQMGVPFKIWDLRTRYEPNFYEFTHAAFISIAATKEFKKFVLLRRCSFLLSKKYRKLKILLNFELLPIACFLFCIVLERKRGKN